MPMELWKKNNLFPAAKIIKGSTLGWNIGRRFISYNQIKKAIINQKSIKMNNKAEDISSEVNPVRIQRSRKHKQISPNGLPIVYVGRPSKWGNPFKEGSEIDYSSLVDFDRQDKLYYGQGITILSNVEAVELFVKYCLTEKFKRMIEKELRGKNLSCWCSLNNTCHAGILLKIANQ